MSNFYEQRGTVNPRPCYSDLYDYGSNGQVKPIIPPVPSQVVPTMSTLHQGQFHPNIYAKMRPHKSPIPEGHQKGMMGCQGGRSGHSCSGYANISQLRGACYPQPQKF